MFIGVTNSSFDVFVDKWYPRKKYWTHSEYKITWLQESNDLYCTCHNEFFNKSNRWCIHVRTLIKLLFADKHRNAVGNNLTEESFIGNSIDKTVL